MTRFLAALILTLVIFSTPATAQIADPVGTLIELEGTGTVNHNGRTNNAIIDHPIYLNDTIETNTGSKAHILFIDETEITISEDSRLSIDEYIYDPDTDTDNKGKYSILRGAFLYVSGFIVKKDDPDVTLETSYGSIGIRGTTVWGGDIDDQYSVFVEDGEITMQTNRARVRVRKGEGIDIRDRNSTPSRARAWQQEKIDRAVKKVALKRKEHVKKRIVEQKEKNRARLKQRKGKRKEIQQEKWQEKRGQKQEQFEKHKEKIKDLREEHKTERLEQTKKVRAEKIQRKRKEINANKANKQKGNSSAEREENLERYHLEKKKNSQD